MKQSVAVQEVKEVERLDAAFKVIVMDDDTTTLSDLRREYDATIVKCSDVNHAKKSFTSALYSLSKHHKILSSKWE